MHITNSTRKHELRHVKHAHLHTHTHTYNQTHIDMKNFKQNGGVFTMLF